MNLRRCASFHSAACVCIFVFVGIGSCARSRPDSNQPATPVSRGPAPDGVARQSLDEAVIEAALLDLITSTDGDSATLRREQGNGKVLFSGKSRDQVGTSNQALADAESRQWNSMRSSDRLAAKAAAAMVIGRVESKQFFTSFRPRDSRISLWEDSPASTQPGERWSFRQPRAILAAPPGYVIKTGWPSSSSILRGAYMAAMLFTRFDLMAKRGT